MCDFFLAMLGTILGGELLWKSIVELAAQDAFRGWLCGMTKCGKSTLCELKAPFEMFSSIQLLQRRETFWWYYQDCVPRCGGISPKLDPILDLTVPSLSSSSCSPKVWVVQGYRKLWTVICTDTTNEKSIKKNLKVAVPIGGRKGGRGPNFLNVS